MTKKPMSLTQVFYSESIEGDGSGQEQGGQWGRFKDQECPWTERNESLNPVVLYGEYRRQEPGIVEFIDWSWL